MHELIRIATAELAACLATHLPTLGEGWWKTHVADRLSFQQQRTVEERGLTKLERLDFSALLRILDQNWFELSQALNLPREGRTWVKELQAVRNRWAHLSASPVPAEDLYRDAHTLTRVLDTLGAAPASIAAVEAVKRDALSDMAALSYALPDSTFDPANTAEPTTPLSDSKKPAVAPQAAATMFKVGRSRGATFRSGHRFADHRSHGRHCRDALPGVPGQSSGHLLREPAAAPRNR